VEREIDVRPVAFDDQRNCDTIWRGSRHRRLRDEASEKQRDQHAEF
jgi:hypothetical protein